MKKFGTLEDWARELGRICTAGRSDIDLDRARQETLYNVLSTPETGASIEISGFELLLTERAGTLFLTGKLSAWSY